LNPVYTIQPVVKPVSQPVKCLYTRYNRLYGVYSWLSNWLYNRYDIRLYHVSGVSMPISTCSKARDVIVGKQQFCRSPRNLSTNCRRFKDFCATVCKTVRSMLSNSFPLVLSVCLSVCLSVTLVYCGQTVGWINVKLGTVGGRP